jgi:hypothetical protein
VCQLLVVFNDVTNIISGSDYPTSNLFLPEVWRMKYVLAMKCGDENEYIRTMACKIIVKFLKYWGECNLLMSIAVVLDPRNKMTLIRFCFPLIYQRGDAMDKVDLILDVLKDLYNEYLEEYNATIVEQNVQSNTLECSSSSLINAPGKNIQSNREIFDSFIRSVDTLQ